MIVPVLHEGEKIVQVLREVAVAADQVPYEIIVVDGDPLGSTVKYLPTHSKVARGLISSCGRGCQMNEGAEIAKGKILLFLHADTQLPVHALASISQVLRTSSVVAGAFNLGIHSTHWLLKLVARIASLRSQLTRIPYGDQAIFIQRHIFQEMGGYENAPIMEDVALMRQLKQKGYTIHIFRDRTLVSPRRWEQEGILYCTLRNWMLLSLYYLGVSPQRLSTWYKPISQEKISRQAEKVAHRFSQH